LAELPPWIEQLNLAARSILNTSIVKSQTNDMSPLADFVKGVMRKSIEHMVNGNDRSEQFNSYRYLFLFKEKVAR
jgi:hypothetical protein